MYSLLFYRLHLKQLETFVFTIVLQTATEAIENIRTVVSLGREETMHKRFMTHLEGPYRGALKKGQLVGFAFGFSQGCIYFVYAAAFVLGAYLIEQSEMDFEDVFL